METNKQCHGYLEWFCASLDHELPAELCVILEAHLKECENCSIVYNTLQRTVELYEQAAVNEQLPTEMRSRLFHRLCLDEFDR